MHAKRYIVTWLVLLGLTAMSFALSFVHIGEWTMPVSLAIATIKASLVALFFMHLASERFGYAFALLLALSMMIVLVLLSALDIETRGAPALLPPALVNESN